MIKIFEQYTEYYDIKNWLDDMNIEHYTINSDLTVDVRTSVWIGNKFLTEIPIQFGKINGDFNIKYNELTTLKGTPYYVNGSFYCSGNNLNTLEYCPKYVDDDFDCSNNRLKTLKWYPQEVKGNIDISNNPLPTEILNLPFPMVDAILFDVQDEYAIWNNDGSFNKGRFDIMITDWNTGML